ncbi:MAG TPA: hypothetical protein VGW57_13185 [Chthoniobacterales bacterium]|nr:hypothetical protein [Chthoniobacterales bacterium]
MRTRLEIRVPISPTPDFFRRIHFMAASLRRLGGALAESELVVCVGGDQEPTDLYDLLPWSKNYPITWRWADFAMYRRDSYWETSREIFRRQATADYVMCADADIIFVRDFSDLLGDLDRFPAVAGVIAHCGPFPNGEAFKTWAWLCEAYGIEVPSFTYEHTGWGLPTQPGERLTPAYFNFGMVIAPSQVMNQIQTDILAADRFVDSKLKTFYRFQIALTLAMYKHKVATRALPLRYNFPNDVGFDEKYPEELLAIRILHYLRGDVLHREKDFATLEAVAALVGRRDLRGSNEVFRHAVSRLYATVAAEEGALLPQTTPL